MQSRYFDAGWGVINLSKLKPPWTLFSVLPSGHRVAEEYKEQTAPLKEPNCMHQKQQGEAFLPVCKSKHKKRTTLTAWELFLNKESSTQIGFMITWLELHTCKCLNIHFIREKTEQNAGKRCKSKITITLKYSNRFNTMVNPKYLFISY